MVACKSFLSKTLDANPFLIRLELVTVNFLMKSLEDERSFLHSRLQMGFLLLLPLGRALWGVTAGPRAPIGIWPAHIDLERAL